MDLSLEVRGMKSLDQSLLAFIKPDTMEGSNAIRCDKCDSKQPVGSGFSHDDQERKKGRGVKCYDFVSS